MGLGRVLGTNSHGFDTCQTKGQYYQWTFQPLVLWIIVNGDGQFWCNGITILTVFLSCYSWLSLLISTHSFLFGCYGYLILQSIMSNNQIDTKVTYLDKNWSQKKRNGITSLFTNTWNMMYPIEILRSCGEWKKIFLLDVWLDHLSSQIRWKFESRLWPGLKKSEKTPVTELRDWCNGITSELFCCP